MKSPFVSFLHAGIIAAAGCIWLLANIVRPDKFEWGMLLMPGFFWAIAAGSLAFDLWRNRRKPTPPVRALSPAEVRAILIVSYPAGCELATMLEHHAALAHAYLAAAREGRSRAVIHELANDYLHQRQITDSFIPEFLEKAWAQAVELYTPPAWVNAGKP